MSSIFPPCRFLQNVLVSKEPGGYLAVVGDFGLAAKIPSRYSVERTCDTVFGCLELLKTKEQCYNARYPLDQSTRTA